MVAVFGCGVFAAGYILRCQLLQRGAFEALFRARCYVVGEQRLRPDAAAVALALD